MFRKILKVFAYSIGGLLVLVAIALSAIYGISNARMKRHYDLKVAAVAIPTDAAAIDRGRHLVQTRGCADCHDQNLAGRQIVDNPIVGVFHGSNLTRGVGGLPADFSDLDYVRAIRHGINRAGQPLLLMPSQEYAQLSDEDLGAVIAYLKSVPSVDRERGPVSPGPLIRTLTVLGKAKLAVEVIDHNAKPAAVPVGITPAYGKYIAATCTGCHGPNLSGGPIVGGPPDWPEAANLTPHADGRLSRWTEDDFVKTLRTQVRPDGTAVNPVMPAAFGNMTDTELKALWAYLRTLPATPHGAR